MKEMLTKSEIKNRPYWTEKVIHNLLGKPDETKRNPNYKNAAPIQLYNFDRIELVEKSEAFLLTIESTQKRKNAAIKSIETKTTKILDYVNSIKIEDLLIRLPNLTPNEAIKKAILSYNKFHWDKENIASLDSDKFFLERITLNYFRHCFSPYDSELNKISGKVGVNEAYNILRDKINSAIIIKYNLHAQF